MSGLRCPRPAARPPTLRELGCFFLFLRLSMSSLFWISPSKHMAMGQNPNRLAPSERPHPTTKIGSKMGGEFTYPKMVPLVLAHSHMALCNFSSKKGRMIHPQSATALNPLDHAPHWLVASGFGHPRLTEWALLLFCLLGSGRT